MKKTLYLILFSTSFLLLFSAKIFSSVIINQSTKILSLRVATEKVESVNKSNVSKDIALPILLKSEEIYEDGIVDIRSDAQSDLKCISFAAYGKNENSTFGHAFVVVGEWDRDRQICRSKGWGYFGKVGNTFVDKVLNSSRMISQHDIGGYMQQHLFPEELPTGVDLSDVEIVTFFVDKVDFDKVNDFINSKPKVDGNYNVFNNNCTNFVHDVGEILGLDMPSTKNLFLFPKTPLSYIQSINDKMRRNGGGFNYPSKVDPERKIIGGTNDTYIGNLKDGKPSGHGRVNNWVNDFSREGNYKNGELSGKCTFETKNDTYTGTYSSGWFSGEVQSTYFDGATMQTTWEDGEMEVESHKLFSDPSKYPNDKTSYKIPTHRINGKYKYSSGTTVVEGSIVQDDKDNRFNTSGTLTINASDFIYEGTVRNFKPNGNGVLKSKDGSWSYTGEFVNGSANGHGVFVRPNATGRNPRVIEGRMDNGRWAGDVRIERGDGSRGTERGGGESKDSDRDLDGSIKEMDKEGNVMGEKSIHGMEITR